jgi:UDP-glucose 4-epimerase
LAEGAELIYHLAAESRVLDAEEDLERTFTTNVQGTFNVLSAALEGGVRRVIFTSSREVYGDPKALPVAEDASLAPKNAYGVSKAAAELWCRAFQNRGLDVVILRLANVYGPGDQGRVIPTFIDRALSGRPLLLYGGSQVLDFVWVGDVVDVLFRAGDMRGGYDGLPINVGSGCGTGLADLAERVRELVDQQVEVVVEPSRPVEVERFVADVSRLRALFGLPRNGDPLAHLPELIEPASGANIRPCP